MVINHFHEWNIQINKNGWDQIIASVHSVLNSDNEEFFGYVVDFILEKWEENYEIFLLAIIGLLRDETADGSIKGVAQEKNVGQ